MVKKVGTPPHTDTGQIILNTREKARMPEPEGSTPVSEWWRTGDDGGVGKAGRGGREVDPGVTTQDLVFGHGLYIRQFSAVFRPRLLPLLIEDGL